MWLTLLIIVYCVLIAIASLVGGWLPSWIRLTHTRMQVMMSLVSGLMMGVALLHLLPHAIVEAGSLDYAATSAVLGLLAMFFLIRIFHVHGHEPHEETGDSDHHVGDTQDHARPHSASCETCGEASHLHGLSWVGLFVGLALHTLIDGVALAASVAAGVHEKTALGLAGFGTFVAVALHKPLDALSITSVMLGGGWSDRARGIVNAVFAVMCPLGALVFFYGVKTLSDTPHLVVGCSLAFAAGAFLCISLADLLPEVQFHRHDRWKLSAALVFGVLLAWAIGFVEPDHAHTHEGHQAVQEDVHEHHDEPGLSHH